MGLFDKKFYLDKIKSEIAQLEHNLHTNYALIDAINNTAWGEADYAKNKKRRERLHTSNQQIKRRLERLRADYKRYEKMTDI